MRNEKTFFDHIPVSHQNYYLASFDCCNTHTVQSSLAQLGTYLVCFGDMCTGTYGCCRYSPSYADPQLTTVLATQWSVCLSLPVVPGLVVVWGADLPVQAVVVVQVVVAAHIVAVV